MNQEGRFDQVEISNVMRKYVMSHDVECLSVESLDICSLSVFSSESLKELKLVMRFQSDKVMESDCWNLPSLKTLSLASKDQNILPQFPKSCLTCLPALTTLCVERCDLPESLSLPALKTLRLESCTLPKIFWYFPSLLTLQLGNVVFPRHYILSPSINNVGYCFISCTQLVNLKIRAHIETAPRATFKVLAPRLQNFISIGLFRLNFQGSRLENVDIRFWDDTMLKVGFKMLKAHAYLFAGMFSQLGGAKILTLDSMTIQVTLYKIYCYSIFDVLNKYAFFQLSWVLVLVYPSQVKCRNSVDYIHLKVNCVLIIH